MTTTRAQHPTFKGWDADALYLCDNGECSCGEHLGSSAMATGRDISGQRVHRITDGDARYMVDTFGRVPKCEGCGKEFTPLHLLMARKG